MKQVVIASANGGTGKTTLCANLAHALRALDYPVLVVDFSPQNAIKYHAGIDPALGDGLSRASLSDRPWNEVLQESAAGYNLLPFGALNEPDRQDFEALLSSRTDLLDRQLSRLKLPADAIVLVDTPAGASIYLQQALASADLLLTALMADGASYASFATFEGIVHGYCQGSTYEQRRYVINRVDRSRQLSSDVAELFTSRLRDRLMGVLHDDQAVCEALASRVPLSRYEAHSQATLDLKHLAHALVAALSATETAS